MSRLRTGSSALMRDLNRTAVLALIGRSGPIARVDLARDLALSPATVTGITRGLLREGLVREVAQAPSNGGRPAILLGLVADAAHAIGCKISPDRVTAVDVRLDGEPLDFEERPINVAAPDGIARLADLVAELAARWSRPGSRLLGVGLGVPGIVNAELGEVEAPILGWPAVRLVEAVRDRVGVPVLIDNDVNTLAVSERLYGRGRTADDVLTVTIGRGVGLGIVAGGVLLRGHRGGAGEFGHVPVSEDGPLCECGNRGCLEAVVADPALVAQAVGVGLVPDGGAVADGVTLLLAAADAGDPRAVSLYERAGTVLGRAVAGLVNVFDPALVIVGGEGTAAWAHLDRAFEAALDAHTFPPLGGVEVVVDPWDDSRWAVGAAALVLGASFATPLYDTTVEDVVRERLVTVTPVPA
jgi:predicted NBD/HSP70 family sugar kinase